MHKHTRSRVAGAPMPAAEMRIYTVLSQPANTNGQSYFEKYNYTRTVRARGTARALLCAAILSSLRGTVAHASEKHEQTRSA